MSYLFKEATFADVQDTILTTLATSYPRLSFSREDHLKRVLLDIMVDDAGWLGNPSNMRQRLERAMDGLIGDIPQCAAV